MRRLITLTTLGTASAVCTHYVCVNGSDSNAGSSWAAPFRTLVHAQTVLANISRPLPPGGLKACICPGVYNESLSFTSADSGSSPDAPVTWQGAADASSILSGAAPIVLTSAGVHPFSGAPLLSANLPAQGISDFGTWQPYGFEAGGCPTRPLELLVDGVPQTVARWPNAPPAGLAPRDFTTIDDYWWTFTTGPTAVIESVSNFTANASAPFWRWGDVSTLYALGLWAYEWADGAVPVTSLNASTGEVQLAADLSYGLLQRGARFFMQNAFDALDVPGEYFLNATTGVLYYVPSNASVTSLAATVTLSSDAVITGTGVSFLTFNALTVTGTRSSGIAFQTASHVAVTNCTLAAVGNSGMYAANVVSFTVDGCVVRDTGGAGLSVNGVGDRVNLIPDDIRISNNVISNMGRVCMMYQPGVELTGVGGVLEHNEISNGPHAVISISGPNIAVENNVVHHAVREAFDCGAMYWYPVDYTKWNVTVRWNLFYLNSPDATPCNSHTSCIRADVYADNGNAGVNVLGNVMWHPAPTIPELDWTNPQQYYAFMNDGGRNTNVTGNIALDSNFTFNGGAGIVWDHVQQNNSGPYYVMMRSLGWNTGVYAEAYPDLAVLHDYYDGVNCSSDVLCPPAPYNNSLILNVAVNCSLFGVFPPPNDFNSSAGFVIANNLEGLDVDPGFESSDPRTTLDFQLLPSSPMYALGFQRIPMECFGPWACQP